MFSLEAKSYVSTYAHLFFTIGENGAILMTYLGMFKK